MSQKMARSLVDLIPIPEGRIFSLEIADTVTATSQRCISIKHTNAKKGKNEDSIIVIFLPE
jgi:hypothetical protein